MDTGTPCLWGVLPMDTWTPCPWGVLPLVIGTPFVVFVLLFGWTYLHPYYKNNPIIIIPLILIIILVLILVNNVLEVAQLVFTPSSFDLVCFWKFKNLQQLKNLGWFVVYFVVHIHCCCFVVCCVMFGFCVLCVFACC